MCNRYEVYYFMYKGTDVVKIWNDNISAIVKIWFVNGNEIRFQSSKCYGYFNTDTKALVINFIDDNHEEEYKNCRIKHLFGVILVIQIYKRLLNSKGISANISLFDLIKTKLTTWKEALGYYRVAGVIYIKRKELFV